MSNIKFCRTNRQCGKNARCAGNLFGLRKGVCTSVQGACRFDKNCPKYYQCVGNQSGLRKGKCLLAISKSNPLSKSVGNISTSLLDPASIYRNRNSINFTFIFIALFILSGIIYFAYGFLKPPGISPPGSCLSSQDCMLNYANLDDPIVFQCGKRVWSSPSPGKAPDVIATIPNKCDCSILQGGGYNSGTNLWLTGIYNPHDIKPNTLLSCCANQGVIDYCTIPLSSTNCKKCKFGDTPNLIPHLLTTSPPS